MANGKTLTFKTLDGRSFKGVVKNPDATLGAVASRLASRVGLAGSFEMVDKDGLTLDPNIKLSDVQAQEITLASELTPA
jgi:hypothetical protein